MFPLRSLAATSPRQLEQLLASTPAFLLPSFAAASSTSSPTKAKRRSCSSVASSSRGSDGKRPSSEVLAVLQEQAVGDALGQSSSSRPSTSSAPRRTMGGSRMAHSLAAAIRQPVAVDDDVEEAPARREGKGVAVDQDVRPDEQKYTARVASTSEELFRKMASAPRERPNPPPISRPTRPTSPPSPAPSRPTAPSSSPSANAAPYPPISTSHAAPPLALDPPATRAELMQLLAGTPSDASLQYLLALQDVLRTLGRMDDSGPVAQLASAGIKAGQVTFARRLFKQAILHMTAPSNPRPNIAWVLERPVKHLVYRRDWDSVVAFTNIAVSAGINSIRLIEWRLQALYELRRYPETVEAFSLFRQHRLMPTGDAYDDLVGAQLLNANLGAAQAALADKAERGFPTTVKTCLALLDGMWMFGGNRVMEQRVLEEGDETLLRRRKAMSQDVKVLNRIMSVRAARGSTEDAFAVLQHFALERNPRLGHALQRLTAAVALRPSAAASTPPTHSYFRPSPDLATVVILIGTFLRLRRTDLASSLFVESQLAGLGLNEYLVAAVVRTHLAQDDLDGAEEFIFALSKGEASVVKPLSRTEVEAGVDVEAETRMVILDHFEPTAMIYEVLLGGVLRFRGLQGAASLLQRMAEGQQQRTLEVTEGMVAALVEYVAIERGEEPRTSAELIVRMYEFTARKRKPTIGNLNQLLESAWRSERWAGGVGRGGMKGEQPWALRRAQRKREARERLMPSAFLEPAVGMLADPTGAPVTLPRSTTHEDRPTPHDSSSPVDRIHASLLDRRTQPDRSTSQHHLRSSASSAPINSMWDYLQTSLIDRGIRPTHSHLTIILRAYIRLGDPSGAHETLQRSFDHLGVEPHVALYSVLVGGLSKLGMWDRAMAVYREMQERGIEPDRTMFATLALGAARRRDVDGVRAVWDEAARREQGAREEQQVEDADVGSAQVDDIRIDPVFVAIMYRALTSSGRVLEAQEMMGRALEEGMQPDEAILLVLQRTRRWLRWKGNKVGGRGPEVSVRGRGRTSTKQEALNPATKGEQQAKTSHANLDNLRRVRSAMRRARPEGKGGLRELQKLEPYLAGKGRLTGRKSRARKVAAVAAAE